MFEPNSNESFPQREERVLEFWQKKGIFKKSVEQRQSAKVFSFYDGPPFATGLPHYGHLLAGTLKDVVPRYKTMKGYHVPRRFGWDCHGLPVENEIEKARELSGAASIEEFGVARFNEECRGIVLRYTSEWERTVNRMGRWVSFDNTYRTMDLSFMESVWWVFGQLYQKGLVYEGFKVMPFSAKLGTPLSNFEANLNYKDVDDPSLTVTFPLIDEPDTSLLVWTTTPWTLPSNLAIMAKKEMEYVKVKELKSGHHYILAKACLSHYFKNPEEVQVVSSFMGDKLEKKRYQPIFPYFSSRSQGNAFRVILEDSIAAEEGTGLVHSAPAFGEVDFFACAREEIELVCPVDHNGKFTAEVVDFAGMYVKDADKEIIKRLKNDKRVFHHGQVRHRYPFCWRSDTPLIYKAVRTWFVAVEKIKERMIAANQKIHWVPDHIKDGRFGKWLENARDWAISRNRYWGTPIPIWRSEEGDIVVVSSIKDLERRVGQPVTDLHRHFIDELTFVENGREFRRVPEVFDCWFESGSMPYAQDHYPFEHKEQFEKAFPADFIAEGLDQTRGWFYTLTVLATALFDQPAFKNVIVNGIILAEDGNKMSKRLKNYPEPDAVINRYGADAIRLYLLNSPAVYGEDLRFSEKGVELILRQALIPFWNAFVFLSTYAKIYQWHPQAIPEPVENFACDNASAPGLQQAKSVSKQPMCGHMGDADSCKDGDAGAVKSEVFNRFRYKEFAQPKAEIDQWILSLLQKLTKDVTEQMDGYQLSQVTGPIVAFIEHLTNWYIRRNRSRFWSEEATEDRQEAFETLYTVLLTLTKITAPFIPFLSEEIYQQLKMAHDPESVHLADFPTYQSHVRNEKLETEMAYVQTIVSLGHGLRKEHKLKVRQPLAQAHIITANSGIYDALSAQKYLIADELNVKDVVLQKEESGFVQLIAKPNFRVLGKKVGKLMNAAQKAIMGFSQAQLSVLLEGKQMPIQIEGEAIILTPEDVEVERKVREGLVAATAQEMTVALNTELNEGLLLEGLAREIVNKINTMRRDGGFAVTDRIAIELSSTDWVKQAFELHKDYIMHEVLGTQVIFECLDGTDWDLNGEAAKIGIALSVTSS